jgi:hypothetical protein
MLVFKQHLFLWESLHRKGGGKDEKSAPLICGAPFAITSSLISTVPSEVQRFCHSRIH